MDILEFFQLSAGKWFSQRTVHNLASGDLQGGKLELNIEILPQSDRSIHQICDRHQVDPALASLAGARVTWEGTPNPKQPKEIGSTVLVPIANTDKREEGVLLQQNANSNTILESRYVINKSEVLILVTESENFYAEERLWFLIPNLRLRSSLVKQSNGVAFASFYSEIRRVSQ